MKTSIVLVSLLVINTSALLSETLASLVKEINPWLLVILEITLLLVFYIHNKLKGLKEIANIDFNGLDVFVMNSKKKTQGKP